MGHPELNLNDTQSGSLISGSSGKGSSGGKQGQQLKVGQLLPDLEDSKALQAFLKKATSKSTSKSTSVIVLKARPFESSTARGTSTNLESITNCSNLTLNGGKSSGKGKDTTDPEYLLSLQTSVSLLPSDALLPAHSTHSTKVSTHQPPPPCALLTLKQNTSTPAPAITTSNSQPTPTTSRYNSEFLQLELLGKGTFGTVHRARNLLDSQEYAIKKIKLSCTPEELRTESGKRFLNEVQVLARLGGHRGVVRYHTAWVEAVRDGESDEEDEDEEEGTVGEETMTSREHWRAGKVESGKENYDDDDSAEEEDEDEVGSEVDIHFYTTSSTSASSTHHPLESSTLSTASSASNTSTNPSIGPSGYRSSSTTSTNDGLSMFRCPSVSSIATSTSSVSEAQPSTPSDSEKSPSPSAPDWFATTQNEFIEPWTPRFPLSTSSSLHPPKGVVTPGIPTTANAVGKDAKKKHRATLYIQMQLANHSDLRTFLHKRRQKRVERLSQGGGKEQDGWVEEEWEENLFILRQIVEALAHIHSQNVIHRDLKPDNVFVQPDLQILLGDFGLAKDVESYILPTPSPDSHHHDSVSADPSLFDVSTSKGTFLYLPPEVLERGKVTTKSDIYAFSILALELFIGSHWSTSMERIETLQEFKKTGRVPEQWRDKLGTEVVAVLEGCVEREPGRRFSAQEVLGFGVFYGEGLMGLEGRWGADMGTPMLDRRGSVRSFRSRAASVQSMGMGWVGSPSAAGSRWSSSMGMSPENSGGYFMGSPPGVGLGGKSWADEDIRSLRSPSSAATLRPRKSFQSGNCSFSPPKMDQQIYDHQQFIGEDAGMFQVDDIQSYTATKELPALPVENDDEEDAETQVVDGHEDGESVFGLSKAINSFFGLFPSSSFEQQQQEQAYTTAPSGSKRRMSTAEIFARQRSVSFPVPMEGLSQLFIGNPTQDSLAPPSSAIPINVTSPISAASQGSTSMLSRSYTPHSSFPSHLMRADLENTDSSHSANIVLAPGETPGARIKALERDVEVLVKRLEEMHVKQMLLEAEMETSKQMRGRSFSAGVSDIKGNSAGTEDGVLGAEDLEFFSLPRSSSKPRIQTSGCVDASPRLSFSSSVPSVTTRSTLSGTLSPEPTSAVSTPHPSHLAPSEKTGLALNPLGFLQDAASTLLHVPAALASTSLPSTPSSSTSPCKEEHSASAGGSGHFPSMPGGFLELTARTMRRMTSTPLSLASPVSVGSPSRVLGLKDGEEKDKVVESPKPGSGNEESKEGGPWWSGLSGLWWMNNKNQVSSPTGSAPPVPGDADVHEDLGADDTKM
ncbi:Eukaryotic translation initiation factor 2-alpha kinase [Chytridiales sp. JEL 0842]|nr:Eukaryotic translation initiation factor 2-alpha kinase [Chytridiales sp. JEL 0842]